MARPKKYRRTWVKKAKELASKGYTDADIGRALGISPSSVYNYKKQHPEFAEAIKEGGREANHAVESALYRRALGYEFEEVTTEVHENDKGKKRKHIKKTVKHIAPEVRAAELWLMNKDPENWRKLKQVEHSGKVNGQVTIGAPVLNFLDMTPKDELTLEKFLEKEKQEKEKGKGN